MATKEESIFKIIKAGEKGNKYWIQAGKDDFYGGFKDYQGTITDDYSQFLYGNHNEAFKEGDVVKVQYTKSVGKDKDGNDKIYKNLKGIYPASGIPASTPQPSQKSPPQPKYEPVNEDKQTTNWDEIALGKTQSLFLASYLQAGNSFADTKLQIENAYQLAKLVVYRRQLEKPENQEEPPLPEIPF